MAPSCTDEQCPVGLGEGESIGQKCRRRRQRKPGTSLKHANIADAIVGAGSQLLLGQICSASKSLQQDAELRHFRYGH
jgi:hypothetical protein